MLLAKTAFLIDPTNLEFRNCGVKETASLEFEMYDSPPGLEPCAKRQVIVKAIQIKEPFLVNTYEGIQKGKAGDYLMQGVEGENYVCDAKVFDATYYWLT